MYAERPTGTPGVVLWTVNGSAETTVLPDGCMDLIWHEDGLLAVGPDTTAHVSSLGRGRTLTGLRFAPGLGPTVFGVPARVLRDERVPLDSIWSNSVVRELTDRVAEDPEVGLNSVVTESNSHASRVARSLSAGATVAAVAAQSGWSERQLYRRCLDWFGYGPKTLSRIVRFDRAIALSDSGVAPSVIAARLGYSDQAHLSREVKALSGLTLGQLAAKRSTP